MTATTSADAQPAMPGPPLPPLPPVADGDARRSIADRPGRVLVLLVGGLLTLLLVATSTVAVAGLLAHQEITETVAISGTIRHVRVRIGNGSVTLTGHPGSPGSGAHGTRTISRGLQQPDHHERLDGDTLVVDADCPPFVDVWCGVSYALDVPDAVTVDVESSSGAVTLQDITGDATVSVSSGAIVASRSGRLDLRASSGAIRVEGASGPVVARASSGAIELEGLTADEVVASTSSGRVLVDFLRAPTKVAAEASSGDVLVYLPDDDTRYDVNTDTGSGSATVSVVNDHSSTRHIDAATRSGDILIAPRAER